MNKGGSWPQKGRDGEVLPLLSTPHEKVWESVSLYPYTLWTNGNPSNPWTGHPPFPKALLVFLPRVMLAMAQIPLLLLPALCLHTEWWGSH